MFSTLLCSGLSFKEKSEKLATNLELILNGTDAMPNDELQESEEDGGDFQQLWMKQNISLNDSYSHIDSQRDKVLPLEAKLVLFIAYGILCVISIFGNALVCYVIFKNKRLHTATNFFIANLAVSDLLVTFVNVPFNIARSLLIDWPFGQVPCHLVNYSLVLTCYVSTYTLTSIALDRHRVVLKPLSRRMSRKFAICILAFIWVVAICLSLPYGMYMRVIKVTFLITKGYRRCRFIGPEPRTDFEKFLTVTTFILQYCIPFTLIAVAYGRIVQRLWVRTHVGAVTATQQLTQSRAKRKSIKLLIAVVIVFAICWLPLNMYHLLTDLHNQPEVFPYNTLAFFAFHWIAISSTCYNPFVYCWLNEQFREEVKSCFCFFYVPCRRSKQSDVAVTLLEAVAMGKPFPRALQSCCYNSINRDPTTLATDLLKENVDNTDDSKYYKNKDDVTTEHNVDTLAAVDADDEEDPHTNYTEEVTQGLILQVDCNGGCKAVYMNGSARI